MAVPSSASLAVPPDPGGTASHGPDVAIEKRRVARNSMLAAGVMTLLKLAAGVLSGSLGVLSDAAHSGLDLAGAALTFYSVQVSDKPADEGHTYGHGKVENLSAFTEAGLMGVSCAWIIFEALRRIFGRGVELHHSAWPVAVLLVSVVVDLWRSRQLRAVAERTGSPALATDASHFASDIWASIAVLAGVGFTWAGEHFGIAWLRYADPFAALAVSLMIFRMTFRLGHEAVSVLTDEIPAETRRRLIREVERVQGVLAVEQAQGAPRRRQLFRRFDAGVAAPLDLRAYGRTGRGGYGGGASRAAPCRCRDPHGAPRIACGECLRPHSRRGRAQ